MVITMFREYNPSSREQFNQFVFECLQYDGITDDSTAYDRTSSLR